MSVITLAVFINSKSPDTLLRSLSAPGVKLRGWFEAEGYFCAALSCLSVGRRLCEQGSLCAMKEHVLRGSNKLEQANRYPDSYPGRLKLSLSLLGLNEISINRIRGEGRFQPGINYESGQQGKWEILTEKMEWTVLQEVIVRANLQSG